jgi:cbb3-type cytochrome oxidase subunit 1
MVRWMAATVMIFGVYIFAYNAVQTVRAARRQEVTTPRGSSGAPALAPAAADD